MSEDIKEKIKGWLEEEKVFKEEVEDEKAEFHFAVEYPSGSGQSCEIIKLKDKDIFILGSRIVLSEEHFKAIHSMPKNQKDSLLWQVRFDLLFREPEFRIIPSVQEFKSIEFTDNLYLEEITLPVLMGKLKEIFRCKLYIIWRLTQLISSADEDSGLYQ